MPQNTFPCILYRMPVHAASNQSLSKVPHALSLTNTGYMVLTANCQLGTILNYLRDILLGISVVGVFRFS